MPPVAQDFIDAVRQQLEKNREAGTLPDSWRGLARKLADTSGRDFATWNDMLDSYKRAKDPVAVSEKTAVLISMALGVNRDTLPPTAERVTTRRLASDLARLEARLEVWFVEREQGADMVTEGFADLRRSVDQLAVEVRQLQPQDARASQGDGK